MQIFHVRHLNDKQHIAAVTILYSFRQTPQMLGTPLCGRIRKGADAVRFQGNTFDLQKALPAIFGKGKIKPGISVLCFSAEIFNFTKTSGSQPFPGSQIRCLGIHIDEAAAFADGNQIIFGFSAGVVAFLAPDLCPYRQKLPAAAGILHVDHFCLAVNLHMGNKPVGPGQKFSGNHAGINHTSLKNSTCSPSGP